jgi:hypothetical protein
MDMVFTIVTVVFGIVISIAYVIEHWSDVLAIATVILGLAIVFAVSWLTMPVCLFAYGAGIVFLLLGWIERGLTKSSARTFSSNAVLNAVRALKDTVLWGLSGLAIVFVVQLVINCVLSMANGEYASSLTTALLLEPNRNPTSFIWYTP